MAEQQEDLAASVCIGTIDHSQNESGEEPSETHDLEWGWFSFRPRYLQWLNSSLGLLLVLTTCSFVYGMSANGFTIAAITSLEKRFHLNSKQTGLISSISEGSSMIVTVIVSFYGSFGNKPRWMGLCVALAGFSLILFAVPHFMVGQYDPPQAKHASQFCPNESSTEDFCRDGGSVSFSWSYFIVFLLSQVLAGAGGASLYSLAIAFLDENVNPKYASIYIAIYYASAFLGPAVGFIVAGQLLTTYVDITLPEDVNISPRDPRWIGNWWLGSLVSGFGIFFFASFILGFPRQIPSAIVRRQLAIKNREIPANDEKISGNIKDIFPATKNLLLNPVYMFQTLGVWAQVIVGAGVGPFMFKLISLHYGATPAIAGLGVGLIGGLSGTIGTVIGSFFGHNGKLKENCKVAAKYCFYFQILGMWMSFMFLLPGCEDVHLRQTIMNSSYNKPCNCDAVRFVPVCSGDVTFYSACHAGCPTQNFTSKNYKNCSFASQLRNGQDLAEVKLGLCDQNCKNLYIFLAGFTLLLTLTYLNDIPGKIVTIRSVSENQRSYALGLQLVLWRLLGALPGPVIFGSFIDKSCILWRTSCGEKGDCLAYKSKDIAFVIVMASMIFQVFSLVFFLLSWYFSTKTSFLSTEEQNHYLPNGHTDPVSEENGKRNGVNGVDNPAGIRSIVEDETRF